MILQQIQSACWLSTSGTAGAHSCTHCCARTPYAVDKVHVPVLRGRGTPKQTHAALRF